MTTPTPERVPWTHEGAAPTAADLLGGEHIPLPFTPPSLFHACNPSIHFDGWRWRCSARAVDYELGLTHPNGSLSKNFLLCLDARLQIDNVVEMIDRSGVAKKPDTKVRGFEDLRLFSRGDRIMALASACDLEGGFSRKGGWGLPEMCELATGKDGSITACRVIRGPWSDLPQKNWMPIEDGVGDTVLYRAYPRLLMSLQTRLTQGDIRGFYPASLRGSSQLIRFDGGWLAVCHESTKKPLAYRHRFVWFDKELMPRKIGRDFVWLSPGVEFCAGLAWDGKRLVASFGKNDREAHLMKVDPAKVVESLHPFLY